MSANTKMVEMWIDPIKRQAVKEFNNDVDEDVYVTCAAGGMPGGH